MMRVPGFWTIRNPDDHSSFVVALNSFSVWTSDGAWRLHLIAAHILERQGVHTLDANTSSLATRAYESFVETESSNVVAQMEAFTEAMAAVGHTIEFWNHLDEDHFERVVIGYSQP